MNLESPLNEVKVNVGLLLQIYTVKYKEKYFLVFGKKLSQFCFNFGLKFLYHWNCLRINRMIVNQQN